MTRRLATLAVLTALAVAPTSALALSSRTRLCIAAARNSRRACSLQCVRDFQNTFASCFGPGADCAAACITAQANCLLDPVSARTACEKDTDPNPSNGIDEGACAIHQRDDLECCGDSTCPDKLDPDPIQCASKARLKGIACNNDCVLRYAPMIDVCNSGFNDCTAACASCRNPADCPIPTVRRR